NADDLEVGVREGVEADDNKRNKTDFVLWFTKSKFEDQELKWDSPWGLGYPGWHIECSAISIKHLGEYLDLHCGGIDNAFPHHTNEIAQSEAFIGHEWCPHWFHVLHLNTSSGKMSKSKGEFLTVSLLEEKGYDPIVYRFFCLQSHYRKSLVFSWEGLDNAVVAYNKLVSKVASLEEGGDVDKELFEEYRKRFMSSLGSDLNTSNGITDVYNVFKAKTNAATKRALIADYDSVLSLNLIENAKKLKEKDAADASSADGGEAKDEFTLKIEEMIAKRLEAKKARDFATADSIRAELSDMGVDIIDTPQGTKYTVR
ncbi:MAG: cysteine--tRNA ligase, partial [Clostridia bacterium]|nr:cysteine--tRNA ligase [Clostridia bacterium]